MEIIKYTVPAILTFIVTYWLLRRFYQNESPKGKRELQKTNRQITIPIRLRAYERLALLLERINPNNLLVNKIEDAANCFEFQGIILNEIRREFEYNASQQIYVSEQLWDEIEDARENLIQLINVAAAQCQPGETATKLSGIVIEIYNTPEETALAATLRLLKEEAKQLF